MRHARRQVEDKFVLVLSTVILCTFIIGCALGYTFVLWMDRT